MKIDKEKTFDFNSSIFLRTFIRDFLKTESSSGVLLIIFSILAIILSNTELSNFYYSLKNSYLTINFGDFELKETVHHWVNDGLMSIFFLVIGLELKREMVDGQLSTFSQVLLPGIAAIGGMAAPAIIYILINQNEPLATSGWAIPTATDIAFSLGILSLLGSRVPISLKIFLTALAIIDDLGAILIIAFFYSGDLSIPYLSLILLSYIVLLILNKFSIKIFTPYLLVGLLMWFFTYKSGIHATIAGVLLASTIPHRSKEKDFSLLIKIEHAISAYVAFFIMPIFAFANAGVNLAGLSLSSLLSPVPLGILLGLFFGKQIGVLLFSYVSIKLKLAEVPNNSNWLTLYGVSILTGIGFTMSLFVGNLAFVENPQYIDGVKIGVLTGSLLSTVFGYLVLFFSYKR